jgi:hypothetical protein
MGTKQGECSRRGPSLGAHFVSSATAPKSTATTRSRPRGRFADRRRQAQIAARHALQRIAAGLAGNGAYRPTLADREREMAAAIHAAELQLPESWLPFVVCR